jgi:hypothetical protein
MECNETCCESFACQSDADCPPDGDFQRYCPPEPDPELGCRVCEYVRCDPDADCSDPSHPLYIDSCPAGLAPACTNGLCECGNVCGGECPDGQFCCVVTGTCDPFPDPCPNQTCPDCQAPNPNPGGTLNETTCQWEGADCTCMLMPPLPPAFAGLHSAVALRPDGIPVLSGYYGDPYGDLIYGVASGATNGATVEWEFVDGVPSDAPCEGDPNGPRGGIAEPGDDVGWDTDVVVDATGTPRISYHDRTSGDLKYAVFNGASWNVHVVDAQGNTGRFTSMVLDSGGVPLIAYMTTGDNLTSYLKVARANSQNPMSSADWTVTVADAAPVPCIPDDCVDPEACLLATGLCQVTQDPVNCNDGAGCDGGFVCVMGQCWEEALDPIAEYLPDGVGLFASLSLYTGNFPAVAYYDSTNGNLKFAYDTGTGYTPEILAGEDSAGNDLGNLGTDAALFIQSDTVHLAYQDADLGDLYYMTFSGQATGTAVVELVDAGARDANGFPTSPENAVGGFHWVGNYASLLADSLGNVRVVYQDGTSSDMVYATKSGGGWTVEILAKKLEGAAFEGAYGFFADQVMNQGGNLAIVSNFKHNLRTDPPSSQIDIRTK